MGNEKTVGFYKLISDEDKKWMIGALLVTDDLGKPEEFRVTHPVKPTVVQRQLYGESLLPHVGMELCGLPLVEALRSKVELLIVSSEEFLALGDAFNTPVVYLQRSGASLTVADTTKNGHAPQRKLESNSGRFEPIQVTCPPTYQQERYGHATTVVADFFQDMDLLEPFDRIDIAVRMLREQDEAFR